MLSKYGSKVLHCVQVCMVSSWRQDELPKYLRVSAIYNREMVLQSIDRVFYYPHTASETRCIQFRLPVSLASRLAFHSTSHAS